MEELRVGQPSEALTFGYNARIKLRRAKRLSKVQTYGNYLRVLQDIIHFGTAAPQKNEWGRITITSLNSQNTVAVIDSRQLHASD